MKLVKIKTLEARIWKLCKEITRANYSHNCIACGKENLEGIQLHTAHLFRKRFLPMQMKYDLRLLRNCCNVCNLRLYGNLEWYFTNMLKAHNAKYILDISEDILRYKNEPMNTVQTREFLLDLEQKYITLLKSYQRTAKPVE